MVSAISWTKVLSRLSILMSFQRPSNAGLALGCYFRWSYSTYVFWLLTFTHKYFIYIFMGVSVVEEKSKCWNRSHQNLAHIWLFSMTLSQFLGDSCYQQNAYKLDCLSSPPQGEFQVHKESCLWKALWNNLLSAVQMWDILIPLG